MGVTRCNTHGYQGFFEVCKHVDVALNEGRLLPRELFDNVEACQDCIDDLDLRRFPPRCSVDTGEAARCYDILNSESGIWCWQCVAAIELTVARNTGAPDPFVAFESTLTYQQQETVDRLRRELSEAFRFRASIVRSEKSAMRVVAGALTYPLEITIYYVVDPAQQQAIVNWIENFFSDIDRKQYRLDFYREESWATSEERPNVWSRGPEELLRRHEVNFPVPPPTPSSHG